MMDACHTIDRGGWGYGRTSMRIVRRRQVRTACLLSCSALVLLALVLPIRSRPILAARSTTLPPATTGENLVSNGDFEAGEKIPDGWQTIDGLSTFRVDDPDPARGRVLKLDTDVVQTQAYEW